MDLLAKFRNAQLSIFFFAPEIHIDFVLREDAAQAKAEMQRLDYNIIHNGYERPQIALVKRRHHAAYQREVL
jgi:hypothetical protein